MLPGLMGIIGSHYQDSYMNQPVSWSVKRVLNVAHIRCCSMQILSYKTNLCANSALFVLCVAPCETSQHCWKRRTIVVLNSSDPDLGNLRMCAVQTAVSNRGWSATQLILSLMIIRTPNQTNMALPDFASEFLDL